MAAMTSHEQELVEKHLYLVRNIVLGAIDINENVLGLGYEDLYQVGCEALCHAAMSYNDMRDVSFATYANVVIKNYLLSHCRKCSRNANTTFSLDASLSDNPECTFSDTLADENDHSISDIETFYLLDELSKKYSGISLSGIRALILKCHGYSCIDIASYYGVKPNHISAWISRATTKLRSDKCFICS